MRFRNGRRDSISGETRFLTYGIEAIGNLLCVSPGRERLRFCEMDTCGRGTRIAMGMNGNSDRHQEKIQHSPLPNSTQVSAPCAPWAPGAPCCQLTRSNGTPYTNFPHGAIFKKNLFVVTLLTFPPELVSDYVIETFFWQGAQLIFS